MSKQDHPKALRITLASSDQIRAWSSGEVTSAATLHYKTLRPEPDGLFSEQIFGPIKDWTCACGTVQRTSLPGAHCSHCGVDYTESWVRRERMGHIELTTPIAHPWYAGRGASSPLALLLDLSPQTLSEILTYALARVITIDESQRLSETHPLLPTLCVGDLLPSTQAYELSQIVQVEYGGVALRTWLDTLNLEAVAEELRLACHQYDTPPPKLLKRLHLVEALRHSNVQPSWMIFSVLPVLPPELRPLVPLHNGHLASSDSNSLYERVLHRNARIKRLQKVSAPEVILNHERRLLQEACDALFDNTHCRRPILGPTKQPLKSLSDQLSGKKGRFRYNLLGKRVDYSGRSVITGDPSLRLDQCGLPTSICLELFKPFVIRKLLEHGVAPSPRAAKRMIERPRQHTPELWDLLAEVMHEKLVLLNRAPTLHRLSIQAFEARRVEGKAIRLHPLVCSGFNADFDGDQMAVHLPLSDEAQREARELLLSTHNLRNIATGEPAISVSQEMVLGLFYLTQDRPSKMQAGQVFTDGIEACLALEHKVIDLHTPITVRVDRPLIYTSMGQATNRPKHKRIETTVGRIIFNEIVPSELHYRNYAMTKEALKQLVTESLDCLDSKETAQFADALKHLGFTYATKSGISFAIHDIPRLQEKQLLLTQADTAAQRIEDIYHQGLITAEERYRHLIAHWTAVTEQISKQVETSLDPWGSLATIINSGATKAKFQQIRQLSGIRGLMARPNGSIIEIPIRGNYVEGLSIREAFTASSAARNGFMGRSLNTAITGYLTRKLVEAGMDVWITMRDCGTKEHLTITNEESYRLGLPTMRSRILGRILAEPAGPLPTGILLTPSRVDVLLSSGVSSVQVRSVLGCQAPYGVCQHCYGSDLSTGELVRLSLAVGVIAGQSIGEPGTQLSMKAFHSGGIANAQGDIRSGLPRVIELFEARIPPTVAPISPYAGTLTKESNNKGQICLTITPSHTDPPWSIVLDTTHLETGQWIEAGTPLCQGALNPHELLQIQGREATACYLINEVQAVFRATGVTIHEKHVECIIRQMLRCVRIEQSGDTTFLPGAVVQHFQFNTINQAIVRQGKKPATAQPKLLGLTKTILQTESWIAAASFQNTSQVLRTAALRGQHDPLRGLKERIITSSPIPQKERMF